ncbi:MAG: PAS domain-containing protein [Chloroflexi bacterium]|nr:PAS domain-containing protein [Chloroflexota bacterium]
MNPDYQYTPYIWPMLGSAIFPGALALYAWKHRTVPGATFFAVYQTFIAVWALFTAIDMAATTESGKILWHVLEAVAAIPALTALICFALEYAKPGKWLTRRNLFLLYLIPFLIIIIMLSNDLHHLFWTRLWLDTFVRVQRGPLNFIFAGFVFLLPLIASLSFLKLSIRFRGVYRSQALLLFFATILPLLTFFLELAGINPIAPLDPVVLVFNINGLLCAIAIFRFGMLGVVPVGRDMAMKRMVDGLLILDAKNRIADVNPAVCVTLALPSRNVIGHPALQVFAPYPELASLIKEEEIAETEINVNREGQSRYYHVHTLPLVDPRGFKLGQLISLQDVTQQRRTREKLLQQQRILAIVQERERLARELHDCLGQALASAHLQAETAQTLLAKGETQQVATQLSRLSEATQAANADIREYLLGIKIALPTEGYLIASLRNYLRKFEENYACPIELVVPPELERLPIDSIVALQLLRIIQEALTNVRKHATAHSARITLVRSEDRLEVTLADDGRGFDPTQLAFNPGFGLRAMRERAEGVGGAFKLHSAPGQGTRLTVCVPLEEQQRQAEPQRSEGD